MPNDILKTLDELDALMSKSTHGTWDFFDSGDACCGSSCTPNGCHESHASGKGYITPQDTEFGLISEVDGEIASELHNNYAAISSALRRAMAVVDGLLEMDFAEKLPDAKWAYNNSENDNAYVHGRRHGYAEVYRDRDRLLSENGFKEAVKLDA